MTDFLPLDHYPQIVFENRDGGDGHSFGQKRDTATVPFSGAVKSVTNSGITLSDRVNGVRRCMMCGEQLPYRSRRGRKTCSANCRKAASRRNETIQRAVQDIQDALNSLERYSDQWPDLYWDIMQAIGKAGIAAAGTSRRVAPKGDARP
jgi:predicted nucleic acid-binding Zn ribbon protein